MLPVITGKQLREARMLRGLDQHQLAELLGTHQKTVSNWERSKVPERQEGLVRRLLFDTGVLSTYSNMALVGELTRRLALLEAIQLAHPDLEVEGEGWLDVPHPEVPVPGLVTVS